MPHVSSNKLSLPLQDKLYKKLLQIFSQAHKKKNFSLVFQELLTDTEKIMFAKRIAIVLLLESDTPQEKIVDILKVSPTTVSKMSLQVEIGAYANTIKNSVKEKAEVEKI